MGYRPPEFTSSRFVGGRWHYAGMDVPEHIAEVQQNGELMAAAAERAGLASAVPSCPDWQVRDLLRHTGYVHRWAARFVAEGLAGPVPTATEAEIIAADPPDPELIGWFREGHGRLVTALTEADPALTCWSFLPAPSPRAFWARRQAHETAIHRVDAELATSAGVTPVSAAFATDGVDELIMGFFGRDQRKLSDAQRDGRRQTVHVRATDTGAEWLISLTEDGTLAASVERGGESENGSPHVELAGPAAGLYLLLWNRADPATAGVAVSGDPRVLDSWRGGMHVTWS
jgi:uncharacterized protein (TIGR03083 family)